MDLPLDLNRPLVAFDLEATSTDADLARIFQFAGIRFNPSGQTDRLSFLCDPIKPIPEDVQELTGIDDKDVEDKPPFSDRVEDVHSFIDGADLLGHNIKEYDIPLLESALARSGFNIPTPEDQIVLDTLEIESELSSLSLEVLYRRYKGEDLEQGHRADHDVKAVLDVLSGQSELYGLPGAPDDIEETLFGKYLDPNQKFLKEDGEIIFQFGKHYGDTLSNVLENNQGYVDWLMRDTQYEDLGQYIEPHI